MSDIIAKLRSQIGDDVQQIYDHEALFRIAADRIEALEAERDTAIASAYEAASTLLPHTMITERAAIRALAPADALAARDALRAEVERLRKAAARAIDHLDEGMGLEARRCLRIALGDNKP